MFKFLFKHLILPGALLAAAVALIWKPILGKPVGDVIYEIQLQRTLADVAANSYSDGLLVGICGAGSPLPDPVRTGPCTFIRAGERMFVVDAGDGAARSMGVMRASAAQLQAVLLTHFHSDHIAGLGDVMVQYWAQGKSEPLTVIGPKGVEQVVRGFNEAYGLDRGYRIAHHGAQTMIPEGFGLKAVSFGPMREAADAQVIYEEDGLKITTFPVNHPPIEPAVGYRFDYRGRSVVFSGDTTGTESVLQQSRGADLLVHEALQPSMTGLIQREVEKTGNTNLVKILGDIPEYHTSPEEAAELAEAAGVKHLVLNHIVPAVPSRILNAAFLGDAPDNYQGPITVALNGMKFFLPANSSEVLLED